MLANDVDRLTPEQRAGVMGPGAPFEMAREIVRGTEMTTFARRSRHLPQSLLTAARNHAERTYIISGDERITFAQTAERVPVLAAALRDAYGVRQGDRVAIVGPNTVEHALTLWATAWLGAIAVGLNGWWTGDELRYGLDLTEPSILIGHERQLDRVAAAAELPVVAFAEFLSSTSAAAGPAAPDPTLDEDDIVAILFTSGTTGRPKGAMITHRGLVNMSMDGQLRGAVATLASGGASPTAPPVMLLPSPLFHISGMGPLLSSSPAAGTTVVFPPVGRWDPLVQLDLTHRHGITNWSGVPTQAIRVLRHPDLHRHDLSSLRGIGFGGAPISPELTGLLARHVPDARPTMGFGMTETCGVGTTISGNLMIANPQSIGFASPTAEVVLRDADGNDIAEETGAVGEIYIRCPSVFRGYWRDDAATAAAIDAGGWFRTGDYGRVVGGMLQLESRLRDLIIRGGENIYPIEIENRLSEHPDLLDAAVIGVPHDELGQEVMAVVVPRGGANVTEDDVRQWVALSLAAFKVPAHVRFVESLPYSPTGKLLKREVERAM